MSEKLQFNENWVVCIDGSKASNLAIHHAIYLANSQRNVIHLIAVHEDLKSTTSTTFENLNNAAQLLHNEAPSLKFEKHLIEAEHAKEAIVAKAKELKACYIFIGTRGLSSLQSLVLGSTSNYVVNHALCPVMVVREQTK